jgi:hypothetical protein
MWILYIVFMTGSQHMQPVATFGAQSECSKSAASSSSQLALGQNSAIKFFCTPSGLKTWQQ